MQIPPDGQAIYQAKTKDENFSSAFLGLQTNLESRL